MRVGRKRASGSRNSARVAPRPNCDGPFSAGHDGFEEARLLKQLMPAVPVIIYTAHSDPFVEKEARSAGAYAVISKSEAVNTLIATARTLFDQMAA